MPSVEKVLPDLQSLMVPIGNVSPLPNNPRRGDVTAIRNGIRRFGMHKPIVVRRTGSNEKGETTGVVLAGNHTLKACIQLKWKHIPVVWTDDSETEALGRSLSDNHVGDMGDGYDSDLLVEMLSYVADDADLLAATAYTQKDIDALIDPGGDEEGGQDETGSLDEQWAVLITCSDEGQQAELIERLQAEGLTVKAMVS